MMKKLTIFVLFLALSLSATSQDETITRDTLRKDALNVYMEASSYLKERITFINYVRDRKVADLVIITTSDRTGSGGREYTMFLEGQGICAGMIDTLVYNSSPDETYDQTREKQVQTLKLGLVRYILKTPLAKYLELDFTEPLSSEVSSDKWNSWVFRSRIAGHGYGESSSRSLNIFGQVSATRITEEWKIDLDATYSVGAETYHFEDEVIGIERVGKSAELLVVKSINDHWSYGGNADIQGSTYSNYAMRASIAPGIEYNIFPYSESTRRQFRFLYTAGFTNNNYIDSTIYDKMQENLLFHSFRSAYEVVQDWGEIDLSVSWSNYLRDFSQNQFSIHGGVEWRIAKGLSLDLGGEFSFIHDQVSLRKGEVSREELLLEIRQLETNYSFFIHFGFSYTFGSIYNNVVNPRFNGSGGMYSIN